MIGDFGLTEISILVVGVCCFIILVCKLWESSKQQKKYILSKPDSQEKECPYQAKNCLCQECGKEITENEYYENNGYCRECKSLEMEEEEEEFPVWEI